MMVAMECRTARSLLANGLTISYVFWNDLLFCRGSLMLSQTLSDTLVTMKMRKSELVALFDIWYLHRLTDHFKLLIFLGFWGRKWISSKRHCISNIALFRKNLFTTAGYLCTRSRSGLRRRTPQKIRTLMVMARIAKVDAQVGIWGFGGWCNVVSTWKSYCMSIDLPKGSVWLVYS